MSLSMKTTTKVAVKPGTLSSINNNDNDTFNESQNIIDKLQSESFQKANINEADCESTQSYLKKQLEIFNIARYRIDSEMKVTFEFLEDLLIV